MQPDDDEAGAESTAISRTSELISVTQRVKAVLLRFIPQLNQTNLAPLVTSVWLAAVDPFPDLWVPHPLKMQQIAWAK